MVVKRKRSAKTKCSTNAAEVFQPFTSTAEDKWSDVNCSGGIGNDIEDPGLMLLDFVEHPEKTYQATKGKSSDETVRNDVPSGSEDEGNTEQLIRTIEKLDGKNAEDSLSAAVPGPESEFHAGDADEAVTIDDVLAQLAGTPGLVEVRKQLLEVAKQDPVTATKSDPKAMREERTLLYDVSKKDIAKFVPQIMYVRKSDQVVMGDEHQQDTKDTAALAGDFRPVDDFEKELTAMMKAAGTNIDGNQAAKLPMNTNIRDAATLRTVARLKALMLQQNITNRRIKKIKSKTYRRIHRKGEAHEREILLERLEKENPELAKQLKDQDEKKLAYLRLQRRRNARKKWAQAMQRFGRQDKAVHQEISKQAQDAHDEQRALRRAISGKAPAKDSDEDLSEVDTDDEKTAGLPETKRSLAKGKQLTLKEIQSLDNAEELPTTGILGMNFMRRAIKEKQEHAKEVAKGLLKEFDNLGDELDDEGMDPLETRPAKQRQEEEEVKRKKTKMGKEFTQEELEAAHKAVGDMLEQGGEMWQQFSVSGSLKVHGVPAAPSGVPAVPSGLPASPSGVPAAGEEMDDLAPKTEGVDEAKLAYDSFMAPNPWLDEVPECSDIVKKVLGKSTYEPNSSKEDDGKLTMVKSTGNKEGKRKAVEMTNVLKSRSSASSNACFQVTRVKSTGNKKGKRKAVEMTNVDEAPDALGALCMNDEAAEKQRELVRTVFVEGLQDKDFAEEVKAEEEKKIAEATPDYMAGWGSWTGEGIVHKPRKPKKTREELKAATIAQKGVKFHEGETEAKKYFADKVPIVYKNPAHFEESMRMPLGREWNTPDSFQQRIKPKIHVKVGAVVTPLRYVKHLPPIECDNALKQYSTPAKKRSRLKARM